MSGFDNRNIIHTVPMFRWAILIIIGIVAGDMLSEYIEATTWIAMMSVCVGLAILCNKKHPMASSVMTLAAIICGGGFRICLSEDDKVAINEETVGVKCKIAVITEPRARGKVIQFDGIIVSDESHREEELVGKLIRVSLLRDTITKKYETIHIGDGIAGRADTSPLKDWHRLNSNFDYIRWLHARGFCGRAFIGIGKWDKSDVSWQETGLTEMLKLKALVIRERILKRIESSGMDYDAFAVTTAMALGNKSALRPELREEYNMAGASHILALSGVHLSIIFMIFSLLFDKAHKTGRIMTLAMVWAYVVFTGMSISVVRAAYMLTIWEILKIIEYDQKYLNVLGFTACIMMLTSPQSIWDIGFQMSFTAVLAIIALIEPMREIMPNKWKPKNKKERQRQSKAELRKYKLLRYGWYVCTVSLSAQIGTMPLTIYYFSRIPLYFILTNLIVIPTVTIIVWATTLLTLIIAIDMIAGVTTGLASLTLAKALSITAGLINKILSLIASLPCSSIEGIHINAIQLTAMYIIIIAGILYINRKNIFQR